MKYADMTDSQIKKAIKELEEILPALSSYSKACAQVKIYDLQTLLINRKLREKSEVMQ